MGSLISLPATLFSRGPAGEASKAGDDGGLKGRDEKGLTRSPTWETIRKVDKDDARSYADVCRAGVEKGKMSKLRLRHFARQSRKAPKDRTV